jgi:hypothetical protein
MSDRTVAMFAYDGTYIDRVFFTGGLIPDKRSKSDLEIV